jgi:hypothetical protein
MRRPGQGRRHGRSPTSLDLDHQPFSGLERRTGPASRSISPIREQDSRREWDSNPRAPFRAPAVFKTAPFVRSGTPPCYGIVATRPGGPFCPPVHRALRSGDGSCPGWHRCNVGCSGHVRQTSRSPHVQRSVVSGDDRNAPACRRATHSAPRAPRASKQAPRRGSSLEVGGDDSDRLADFLSGLRELAEYRGVVPAIGGHVLRGGSAYSSRFGAPKPVSTAGTAIAPDSSWKFSITAISQRAVIAVPFSV